MSWRKNPGGIKNSTTITHEADHVGTRNTRITSARDRMVEARLYKSGPCQCTPSSRGSNHATSCDMRAPSAESASMRSNAQWTSWRSPQARSAKLRLQVFGSRPKHADRHTEARAWRDLLQPGRGSVRWGSSATLATIDARRRRLVGWGMATGFGKRCKCRCGCASCSPPTPCEVSCATWNIGTAPIPSMAQGRRRYAGAAARDNGARSSSVSKCRNAPAVEGGSWIAASVFEWDRDDHRTRSVRSCGVCKADAEFQRRNDNALNGVRCGWHAPYASGMPRRAVPVADAMRHDGLDRIRAGENYYLRDDDGSHARKHALGI